MAASVNRRSKKAGLPPGTLIHVGEKKTEKVRIMVIEYDDAHIQEREAKTVEECFPLKGKPAVTWINIVGLHQVDVIEKIGEKLDLHPLLLEDILNTEQRPKMEDFESYMFIVLKMLYYEGGVGKIKAEQVSLIFGTDFVISFQEEEGDVFNPVRETIRSGKGRIRKMGADYLTYALMDAIVDSYFIILERLGERIEDIEVELVVNPKPKTLGYIHSLKREMILLRKSVWPLREVVSALEREETPLIKESTGIYLRDVYDHTIQVVD